jgi:hypothetical protein
MFYLGGITGELRIIKSLVISKRDNRYWHKKRRFVDKYQLDFSYLEFMPWGYSRDHISDISSSLKKISDQLPGGMIHNLQNMFKNVPSKYQRDDKEQNVDSSIEAEDAENEPK